MPRTQQLTKVQHADIRQEIKQLRSRNKVMWRELSNSPDIRFLVKTEKHKHQLDLNATFLKNEARLKRLHAKIGREWISTPNLPDRTSDAAFLAAFVTIFSVVAFIIIQAVRSLY